MKLLSLIDAEVLPDSRDYVYTKIASRVVGVRSDVALDAISRANVLIFAHSTSDREEVAYFAESRLKEGNIDEALTVVEKMIAPNSGSNFFADDAQLGNAQAAVLNTLSHISEAVAETPELRETYGRQLLDQLKTVSIRYGNWTKSETEQLENDELGLMDRITLAWNQILGKIAENMKSHGLYKPTPESYIAMGLSINDTDNEAVAYYRKLSRAIFHFKSVRRFMETTERPTEFRVIRRETGGSHLALFEELPLHDRYSLQLTESERNEFKSCFKEANRKQIERFITWGLQLQLTDM